MTADEFENPPGDDTALRDLIATITRELEAAHRVYGVVHAELQSSAVLTEGTRETAIGAIASVATLVRGMSTTFAAIDLLPESEQVRLAVVMLRVITDSLSVALGHTPDRDLLVNPADVDALVRDTQDEIARIQTTAEPDGGRDSRELQ